MSLRKLLGLEKSGRVDAPAPTAAAARPTVAASAGIGFYGKLPTQADFVRINAGGFATAGFDRWLEDGVGSVLAARATPSPSYVAFFAYSADAPNPCMGILGPSHDKVGRQFPAALFAYLDPSMAGLTALAADALGSFLFQAQAVVAGLAEAGAPPALETLALPDLPAQMAAAEDAGQQLARANLNDTLDMVFGPSDPQVREHALATCLAACATTKGQYPMKAAVTLELPAADDRARDFWLSVITTALAWPSGAPTWLWDDRADRLLLSLGPPNGNLLLALAAPEWQGPRHWVITTRLPDTAPAATLAPAIQEAMFTPETTVGHLLAAIASS